jgi:hypothetical protein
MNSFFSLPFERCIDLNLCYFVVFFKSVGPSQSNDLLQSLTDLKMSGIWLSRERAVSVRGKNSGFQVVISG